MPPVDNNNETTNDPNRVATPEESARAARDAADEANQALREIRKLHGEMMSRPPGHNDADIMALRPPKQGVSTSPPVGSRPGVTPEAPQYQQRRDVDENTRRSCICGAPLWAHTSEKPYGCPDNDCPEFQLAPR